MHSPDRTGPFRRMLVLGDSIAYGMCASDHALEWPQVAANLIRRFQDPQLEVFNRALPATVISPRCPGYEESAKPSLIEHYQRSANAAQPDLVLIAEGLNDMRSGMPLPEFVADLEAIVTHIQRDTGALVVLVGIYHQRWGCGANDPAELPTWTRWDHDSARAFNDAISNLAVRRQALFVDAQTVLGGSDWVLNPDCCHLNDLGHTLVGQAVFQTLAVHCPGLAEKTLRRITEEDISIANSGGADASVEIQQWWRQAAARFGVSL